MGEGVTMAGERDSARRFTNVQRREMFFRQQGRCASCSELLDEFEGDHVARWSRGGVTQTYNGQLLCKACHKDKTRNE